MKVGYLGPKGTFSDEAAHQFFLQETQWYMYDSILDVFEAVSIGHVDKCIVPIENSIAGNIHMTIDGLLMYNLRIEADLVFSVSLHLIGDHRSTIRDIKMVRSIGPAINQCRQFIKQHGFKVEYADSTARAAALVKDEDDMIVAAIASSSVAQEYGLNIIAGNIQDNSSNFTRFIVVSKSSSLQADQRKTMMLVTPNLESPGVLSSILNVFSALQINLLWIESRPTGKKLGTYRFLIESELAQNDPLMIKAVKILEAFDHEVLILGSYATTVL